MGKIFVNYRRDDVRGEAARIHDRLASVFGNPAVFMDVDNLLAGQRFDRELEKALAQCDVFLAIMGPHWLDVLHERQARGERDYVCEEIAAALQRDILVIPVLVERATLPKADKLPEEIRSLVLHQKHDITHESFGRDMGALIDAIKAGRKGGTASSGGGLFASPMHGIGLAAAALLAVGGIAIYGGFISSGSPPPVDPGATGTGATAAIDASKSAKSDDAERAWDRVKDSRSVAVLDAYSKEFGNTFYATLARERIAELTREKEESAARKAAPAPKRGATFRDCPECPEMVTIPAGEFLMGTSATESASLAALYPESFKDEWPQRKVTIGRPFAVGKTHVTRGEFQAFVNATGYKIEGPCFAWTDDGWKEDTTRTWLAPGYPQDDRHPVVCVSWHDAKAYANWLTKITGGAYRLMTEAEAEYIARATTVAVEQPRYFFGNEHRDLCTYANGADDTAKAQSPGWVAAPCSDGYIFTAPGANYKPNPFGVYDVNGNAWTWTEDCYVDNYSSAPTNGAAVTGAVNCERALRGGSWIGRPEELGSAVRSKTSGSNRVNIDGFRVAKTL